MVLQGHLPFYRHIHIPSGNFGLLEISIFPAFPHLHT